MKLPSLLASLPAASAIVGLILPIYIYPTTGPQDWAAVTQAAASHPQLPFYIIVNNNGGAPYTQNPPPNIIDWADPLGSLTAKPNVRTIGYIATTFGNRPISEVKAGIDQYLLWSTQQGWSGNTNNISIAGIFFDEIDTSPSKLAYNTEIATYAKTQFAARSGPVVLNPGVHVQAGSESLWDVADAIMNIETCYTSVQGATDPGGVVRCPTGRYTPFTPAFLGTIPAGKEGKSSVVVHDYYESWEPYVPASLATVEAHVNAIVNKGVHSLYLTQFGYTADFTVDPASVGRVAGYAAAAQGLV
ncbi:hypothetical protein OQA88_7399 [Cercophora sp. LCS_1]